MEYLGIILIIAFIALAAFLGYSEWNEKRIDKRRGYRIEFVSPNVLCADENEFAVVYHKSNVHLWFYGKEIQGERILEQIPSMSTEEQRTLWNNNRDTILKQISDEMSSRWKRMKMRYESTQQENQPDRE